LGGKRLGGDRLGGDRLGEDGSGGDGSGKNRSVGDGSVRNGSVAKKVAVDPPSFNWLGIGHKEAEALSSHHISVFIPSLGQHQGGEEGRGGNIALRTE
jgi:hypothetical protein